MYYILLLTFAIVERHYCILLHNRHHKYFRSIPRIFSHLALPGIQEAKENYVIARARGLYAAGVFFSLGLSAKYRKHTYSRTHCSIHTSK